LGFPVLVGLSRKSFLGRLAAMSRFATRGREDSVFGRRPTDGAAIGTPGAAGDETLTAGRVASQQMTSLGSENDIEPVAVSDRLAVTLAAELWAADAGARIIRTHEPRAARDALDAWTRFSRRVASDR